VCQLIVSMVRDMFEECGRTPTEGLPTPTDNLDGWIDGLAMTFHTRNVEVVGQGFWDIHAPDQHASEVLAEVSALRCRFRTQGIEYLATPAWQRAGAEGELPHQLPMAFALNFSAFTTQALMVDFNQTPAQIGSLTADILKALLRRAVEVQCSQGPLD